MTIVKFGLVYKGIQLYVPSTNNAVESTNRTIKDDGTFRERYVLSRFLTTSSDIIRNWSIDRDMSFVSTMSLLKFIIYQLVI